MKSGLTLWASGPLLRAGHADDQTTTEFWRFAVGMLNVNNLSGELMNENDETGTPYMPECTVYVMDSSVFNASLLVNKRKSKELTP